MSPLESKLQLEKSLLKKVDKFFRNSGKRYADLKIAWKNISFNIRDHKNFLRNHPYTLPSYSSIQRELKVLQRMSTSLLETMKFEKNQRAELYDRLSEQYKLVKHMEKCLSDSAKLESTQSTPEEAESMAPFMTDARLWESRELGASEEYVAVASDEVHVVFKTTLSSDPYLEHIMSKSE